MPLTSSVHRVHFEDFSATQFERLVFAYLLRTERWRTLEWYGEGGGDWGTDIWGVKDLDGDPAGLTICVQCANRRRLTSEKVRSDLDRVAQGPKGLPDGITVISGGPVSAGLREKAKTYALSKDVWRCEVWSGAEFEERLRSNGESLLRRFVAGEAFPEGPEEIRAFVASTEPMDDHEILGLMAGLLDRPAFYTPFRSESSVPAFKKAITDTIEALNTGIHRLRDGTEIRRIPSRHQLRSKANRDAMMTVERMLSQLRARYDDFIRQGKIRLRGGTDPDCAVFIISWDAADEMDLQRSQILETFRQVYPEFGVRLGW